MATSSFPEPKTGISQWLEDRLSLSELTALARHKTVPQHKYSFWYYWGGISLFLFLVQLLTGILLLVYFRPGKEAYESVRQITYDIEFGWLIRSAHSWSANLMVFAVFVHMFSAFFMKAYRKPREFGWWSGVALLGLTLVFGFSGYLLPMDELSYFATKVGLQMPGMIPVVGPVITDLIRGGMDVGEATVQRFFALHAVVLPLLFLPILLFHLFLVQKHGNAVPPSEEARPVEERRSVPFPQLRDHGPGDVADRTERGHHPRDALSLGSGRAGRRVNADAHGHPSGVVFHVSVPGPESGGALDPRRDGRNFRDGGVRSRNGVLGPGSLVRHRQRGRAQSSRDGLERFRNSGRNFSLHDLGICGTVRSPH